MIMLKKYVDDFISHVMNSDVIDLYNEAGLQYELAIYLRGHLPSEYKVQLERNIRFFYPDKNFRKSEMDICVFHNDERHCIEIKFPGNGATPRRMYQCFEDVNFLEELRTAGFCESIFLFVSDEDGFFSGRDTSLIYQTFRIDHYFRQLDSQNLPNFLQNERPLSIQGQYGFEPKKLKGDYQYFLVAI